MGGGGKLCCHLLLQLASLTLPIVALGLGPWQLSLVGLCTQRGLAGEIKPRCGKWITNMSEVLMCTAQACGPIPKQPDQRQQSCWFDSVPSRGLQGRKEGRRKQSPICLCSTVSRLRDGGGSRSSLLLSSCLQGYFLNAQLSGTHSAQHALSIWASCHP